MTTLIINNFLYGFAFSLFVYFAGYSVRLIESLAHWK